MRKMNWLGLLIAVVVTAFVGTRMVMLWDSAKARALAAGDVVAIHDGHQIDPRDGGRPVVLIASALGVSEDVFRDTFSGVQPARGLSGPSNERVQENKRVLLDALGKHGVTNERLDEVSDYYRYRPGGIDLWRHRNAVVAVKIDAGQVVGFDVIDAGAGYTSVPKIFVPGHPNVTTDVKLAFGKDLATNGRIASVTVITPSSQPGAQPATQP